MITIDNCALFIGVNDYRAFDESLQNPPGTSDLHGSCNDARAFWRVCRELGIRAENMRILTSPPVDPEDIGAPAECVGEATEAAIVAGVSWLGARLGGDGRPPGLLTYSGHGDFIEREGLVICPSDVTGADLAHAIPFVKLERLLAGHDARANLTVVLDCCHSGAAAANPARRRRSLTGRPLPAGLKGSAPRLADHELCACGAGGSSWQARFSGAFRGAFSWALAAVVEQWKPRIEGTSVELTLSYGELLERAQTLLATLSFDDAPVLRGRPDVATIPVFHRGPGGAGEATSATPTARRKGGQLNPDSNHTLFTSVSENATWGIRASGSSATPTRELGYTNDTEYWGLDSTFVQAAQRIAQEGAGSITFGAATSAERPSSTGFSMPTNSLWTPISAMPTGPLFSTLVPAAGNAPSYVVGIAFELTAPAEAGDAWGGTMTWYVGVPLGEAPPAYVIGSGTTTLTYGALPSGVAAYSWSFMTLPPLTWSSAASALQAEVGAPSLAALGTTLYAVVSADPGMSLSTYAWASTGAAWSRVTRAVLPDAASPALAAVEPQLYLAYQSSNQHILLASSSDPAGNGWTPLGDTAMVTSDGGFALAGMNGALYLAYLDPRTGYPSVCVRSGGGAASWTGVGGVSIAGSGTPALAAFDGVLYLAFTTTATIPSVKVYRSSGSQWVETADLTPLSLVCEAGFRAPALGAWNGRLFLACRDASSSYDVWLCSTSNGTTWSGYEDLTDQNPDVKASIHPALAALGSVFFLAYPAPSGRSKSAFTLCSLVPELDAGAHG